MGTLLQRYKKHQTQNEKSNPAIFQCGFQKAAISREAGKVVIGIILKAVRACGHWATANRMRMNIRLNARAVGIAHFVRIILIKMKGGTKAVERDITINRGKHEEAQHQCAKHSKKHGLYIIQRHQNIKADARKHCE